MSRLIGQTRPRRHRDWTGDDGFSPSRPQTVGQLNKRGVSSDAYCEKIDQLREVAEARGLTFREAMMAAVDDWIGKMSQLIGETKPRRQKDWDGDSGEGSQVINPNLIGLSARQTPQHGGEPIPFGPDDNETFVDCRAIHGQRTGSRQRLSDDQIRELLSLKGKLKPKAIALRFKVSYNYVITLLNGGGRAAKIR